MQKDLPTLSFEQYKNILKLDHIILKEDELVKDTTTYPDKLSEFLANYLEDISHHHENKNE